MDNETVNVLIARLSALERLAALLLAEELKRMDPVERMTLEVALKGKAPPPKAPNISIADDWAGRAIEFERAVASLLETAQALANVSEGQTAQG